MYPPMTTWHLYIHSPVRFIVKLLFIISKFPEAQRPQELQFFWLTSSFLCVRSISRIIVHIGIFIISSHCLCSIWSIPVFPLTPLRYIWKVRVLFYFIFFLVFFCFVCFLSHISRLIAFSSCRWNWRDPIRIQIPLRSALISSRTCVISI